MKSKKIMGLFALLMLMMFMFVGKSAAVNLLYNEYDQQWRDLEVQAIPWRVANKNVEDYDQDNDYYGTNCFGFVKYVIESENRGSISTYHNYGRELLSYSGGTYVAQDLNSPSTDDVRNAFSKATPGDVVQMRWGYYAGYNNSTNHTAIINGFEGDGVYFFQSHVSGNGVKKIKNSYYSYAELARRYSNPGANYGGFTIYHFGDPVPPDDEKYDTRPAINPGLQRLSSSSYAKVYIHSPQTFYDLYSDSELTRKDDLSSNYVAENEECQIHEVGWNSKNVPYAHIKFPRSNGKLKDAYVSLKKAFIPSIPDMNTGNAKTATGDSSGFYRRADWSTLNHTSISTGKSIYCFTPLPENDSTEERQSLKIQVMYPSADGKNWVIAWTSQEVYEAIIGGGAPVIERLSSPSAVAGVSYSNYPFEVVKGSVTRWRTYPKYVYGENYRAGLPSGLSMNTSTGRISGVPAHTSEGKSSYYVLKYWFYGQASNSVGTSDPLYSIISVWEPPVITTSSTLANGDVNKYYSATIRADGTEHTMQWSKINGSLPPGLRLVSSVSSRTARIEGTPSRGGEYKFTIKCSNGVNNSDTKEFTIRVGNIASEYKDSRISFTYYFYNGRVGNNYSDYVYIKDSASWLNVNSGEKYIFIVTDGEVPDGLYFEEKNTSLFSSYAAQLYLKGVPKTAKSYQFTVKAKRLSDGGYNTKTFNMNINSSSTTVWRDYNMSILYTLATNRPAGVSYSDYVLTRGGTQPYTASIVGGNLPNGLTLEQDGAITRLKGIPKREGNFSFTLRVMGNHKGYVDKTLYVNIVKNPLYKSGASENGEAVKPKISSTKLPDAAFGNYWEATLEAYGTQPIAWYAETELPEGFDIDEETGKISGIPMEVKKYKFKVKAENELGSTTKKLKLKVLGEKPVIQTHALPDGVLNASYDVELEFSGTAPIKWKKVGKLPSGLKLNKKEGRIEGTPKKAGTYEFSIKAKNKAGYDVVPYKIVIHETEPTKEEENNNTTETSAALNTVGATPYNEADSKGFNAAYTELFMLSDDEKLEGSILKEDNKPMNFVIDEWVDEYGRKVEVSDVKIFVNDELVEGVEISDEGIFTLSEDIISGEVTVYASAIANNNEIKTSEVNVVTAGNEENQNSESSSGGCSLSFAGVASIILTALAFFKVSCKKSPHAICGK